MPKEDAKEKTEDAAGKAEPPKEAKKTGASDLLGDDDDLMDLFGEVDEVNEELAALTLGLDDVAMGDLPARGRDIRAGLGQR